MCRIEQAVSGYSSRRSISISTSISSVLLCKSGPFFPQNQGFSSRGSRPASS